MAMAEDVPTVLFTIIGGETLVIRNASSTTANCTPLFESFEAIDVLEGSEELTLKGEPGMVSISSPKGPCPNAVPGVKVLVTAANVTEKKEVPLTFRVRYKTKNGPWQQTGKFKILMFPKPAPGTPPKS